jgi:hypothetical protein
VEVTSVDRIREREPGEVFLDSDAAPSALALPLCDEAALGISEAWAGGDDDGGTADPVVPLGAFFSAGPAGLVSLGPVIGTASPRLIR